ncbi:MAG: insulinase family protein [Parcubacteria group bacterium]|nr:insulinase family protein [Parcubacteria group bacterium]
MLPYERQTLESGLRVVAVPMPSSLTTTVLVLTATGSKYETKPLSGVSHFLEHMCFKGTKKRPSAQAVSEELDGLGARYNAFTSHEYTGYFAKVENRLLPRALDVVADIFLNSTLSAGEMEKERGVIIGEIEMGEDDPQRHVVDIFLELLYGDQPAGWNVAGNRGTIKKMTRGEMADYRATHYVGSATVVVIAGNFDKKTIWSDIEKAFEGVSRDGKTDKEKIDDSQSAPAVKTFFKDTSQTHLLLGFRSFDVYDERQKTLRLLAAVLGGGMSSRLFKRVRDEMGAGYYVSADNDFFTDHGFFSIATGVANPRVKEVLQAILEETTRMKTEDIPAHELERTKNFLIGGLFSGLETSNSLATFYGGNEILGKPMKTPQEIADDVRAITAEDISAASQNVARRKRDDFSL